MAIAPSVQGRTLQSVTSCKTVAACEWGSRASSETAGETTGRCHEMICEVKTRKRRMPRAKARIRILAVAHRMGTSVNFSFHANAAPCSPNVCIVTTCGMPSRILEHPSCVHGRTLCLRHQPVLWVELRRTVTRPRLIGSGESRMRDLLRASSPRVRNMQKAPDSSFLARFSLL